MNVDHKDPTQQTIVINDKSYDTSTSVVLSGTHIVNYGYDIHSNLLHIMEHFCGDIEPYNSIPGQLWYDRLNDKLNVNTNSGYVELGYTRPPILPGNATTSDILKIRLEDLLSVNGGTMRGALILKDMNDNDPENAAVSKRYIDSKMVSSPTGLIPIRGNDEPAGRLHVNDILPDFNDSPMIAANKRYVDKVIPHIDVIGPTSVSASDNSPGKNTIVTFHQSELLYIYGQHTLSDVNNNKLYALVVLTDATIKAASVQINIFDGELGNTTILPSPPPTPSPSPSTPLPSEPPNLPTNINNVASGGEGITINRYIIYRGGGTLNVHYNMYGAPDQMEIFVDGVLVEHTKDGSGANVAVSGASTLTLSGNQVPNYANIEIKMTGPSGTAWDYTMDYTYGIQQVTSFPPKPSPAPSPLPPASTQSGGSSSSISAPKLPTLSGIVRNVGDSIVLYVRYFGKPYSNLTFDYAITGIVKTIPKTTKSKTLDPLSLITADDLANKTSDELENLKDQFDWSNSQLSGLSNDQLDALGASALMTLDTTLVNTVTPTIGGFIDIADTSTLSITINNVKYTKDDININGANRWFINIPPKNLLVPGNSYEVTYSLNNGADVSIGSFTVSTSAEIVLVDPSDGHKFILAQKIGESHGTWDECVSFAGLSNTNKVYGYSDWRLPSKSELQTIYNNLVTIKVDNTFAPYKYWSNDSSTDSAWCINYGSGVINECNKQYSNFVRLVRNV